MNLVKIDHNNSAVITTEKSIFIFHPFIFFYIIFKKYTIFAIQICPRFKNVLNVSKLNKKCKKF